MIIKFSNVEIRFYPRMYLRRFLAKFRSPLAATKVSTKESVTFCDATEPCSICTGPSRLLGRSVIETTKVGNEEVYHQFIDFFHKLGHTEQKLYLCQDCGMIFVRPFPTDQEVVELEAGLRVDAIPDKPIWSAPTFTTDLNVTWACAVRTPRLNQIIGQHFTRPLRLLDVGAHGGTISLNLDLPKGSSVDLVQFDTDFAWGTDNKNVRQFRGLLSDIRGQDYKADVILALHVLEHVDDPRAFLADIRALLTDDGICIIEVPYELQDAWSTAANRILSWAHKSFFAPWSVLEAVRLSGFQIVEWELMDCHNTGGTDHAPSPGQVTRVTARKTDAPQPQIYPTGYGFVRSLDRLFGNFAGSLAYYTERPFQLFVYHKDVMHMTHFFTDRPGFRGIYSSNPDVIDGVTVKDIYVAELKPDEVIVTLEWYVRDDVKGRFKSVEVI